MKLFLIVIFSLLSVIVFADEQTCMASCDQYKDQCIQDSKNAIEEDSSYCTQRLSECYIACKAQSE